MLTIYNKNIFLLYMVEENHFPEFKILNDSRDN